MGFVPPPFGQSDEAWNRWRRQCQQTRLAFFVSMLLSLIVVVFLIWLKL